jgi:hypothetical protein
VSRITEYVKSFQNRNSRESSAGKSQGEQVSLMAEASLINFPKIMRGMILMRPASDDTRIQFLPFKNHFIKSKSWNAFSSNAYAALGSMSPCILDAGDTLNNHIKTDSYEKAGVI